MTTIEPMNFDDLDLDQADVQDIPDNTPLLDKIMKLFPYNKPNTQQGEIISAISDLGDQEHLLIQAATGAGKTIATLASVLAKLKSREKLIFFTRTISQFEPVIREWGRLVGGYAGLQKSVLENGSPPLILPMVGKAKLCKQLPIIQKNGTFDSQAVHILCKSIDCQLFPGYGGRKEDNKNAATIKKRLRTIDFVLATTAITGDPVVERLYELHAQEPTCGYYDQRELLKYAKVVVASYPYMQEPLLGTLLKKMGVHLEDVVMVIDEAHNLTSTSQIGLLREDIEYVRSLVGDMAIVKNLMKSMDKHRKLTADDLGTTEEWEFARRLLAESDHPMRKHFNITLWDLAHPSMIKMNRFMQARDTGNIITNKQVVKIIQATPDKMIGQLTDAKNLIFQSGTLTPIHNYKKMFGLPKAKTLVTTEDDKSNQFRAYLRSGLTSKKRRRNPRMYQKMADMVIKLYSRSPRHTLVICPSYAFKEPLLEEILLVQKNIHPRSRFDVVDETRDLNLKKLSQKIKGSRNPILIVGVSGGKISEGVEIVAKGHSLISLVIFAGLPYVPPSQDQVVIRRALSRAAGDKKAAQAFMQSIPISRAVRQAFGRTVRGSHDRGALVILDFRAEKSLKRELLLTSHDNPRSLLAKLSAFFRGYLDLSNLPK